MGASAGLEQDHETGLGSATKPVGPRREAPRRKGELDKFARPEDLDIRFPESARGFGGKGLVGVGCAPGRPGLGIRGHLTAGQVRWGGPGSLGLCLHTPRIIEHVFEWQG